MPRRPRSGSCVHLGLECTGSRPPGQGSPSHLNRPLRFFLRAGSILAAALGSPLLVEVGLVTDTAHFLTLY
ncbi:conserved protein of unknown function [Candidatus Bipolaricaulis anaerobius]|uniref:Uncharacterized protein n=1 Tax=Candidatus Bipolaricaulis anaerobius TaxID=2026885 RepID=A0A2X3L0T2_9BACT|nr:conserved protein of unknown function [Candidatus Bipolaricaulis anaerobius]